MNQTKHCPRCGGKGELPCGEHFKGCALKCDVCRGTGRINVIESLPAEVKGGETYYIKSPTEVGAGPVGGSGSIPHPSEAEMKHTPVTDEILKIIDTERSRYKVSLALTAWHTKQVMEIIGPYEGVVEPDGTITLDTVENVGDSFIRNALRAEQRAKLKEARL